MELELEPRPGRELDVGCAVGEQAFYRVLATLKSVASSWKLLQLHVHHLDSLTKADFAVV